MRKKKTVLPIGSSAWLRKKLKETPSNILPNSEEIMKRMNDRLEEINLEYKIMANQSSLDARKIFVRAQ